MAALTGALVGAAGIGAAVAPVTHGQTKTVRAQTPRAVDILLGGGSRIGVSIREIEEGDAKTLKGATTGVVVESVSAESPAEKAGIRQGDVIVEFDGERVRSVRQLTRLVQETPEGRGVPSVLLRDGQRTTVTVTPDGSRTVLERFSSDDLGDYRFRVAPRPPAPPTPPTPPTVWRLDELVGRTGALGITVDTLSSQLAEYFGAKQGVLVTSVYDNSVAAKAGVKAGDVITSLNGAPVDDPADVRRRTQGLSDGAELTIEVLRDKKSLTLKGKVERVERRRTSRTVI
jgi:serine protease Do